MTTDENLPAKSTSRDVVTTTEQSGGLVARGLAAIQIHEFASACRGPRKGAVSNARIAIAKRDYNGDISATAGTPEFLSIVRANVAGQLDQGANAGGIVAGAAGE